FLFSVSDNMVTHICVFDYFQCLGRQRHEEETKAVTHHQLQSDTQKITQSALIKLLSGLRARVAALERSLEDERENCRAERQKRKELHNMLVELRGNIRVHCRVRPVLPFDHTDVFSIRSSEEVIHAISDDTVMVNCMKAGMLVQNKMFEFERVHGPEDSQDVVFEEVKSLLTSLLDGYNVCIMAYGQTGSGKTHTMMGSQFLDELSGTQQEAQQGIIPKAAAELISEKPAESHTVEVSVLEVYNNEVFDLLARDERNAAGQRRDVITTRTEIAIPTLASSATNNTAKTTVTTTELVQKLRAHCPTLVHTDSSRSHLIVTLTNSSSTMDMRRSTQKEWWSPRCRRANLTTRNSSDELSASPASSPCSTPSLSPCPSPRNSISETPFRTKLQLVDLAGSECVGMSGVSGAALWESSCINRSLSALFDVLGALAEHRPHVPYRNSKLTHLLQDAIGGDAKLLVMLCVSPTQRFITESLQSLGFGTRARQVQKEPPRRKNNSLKVK
uniref:Kinesin family member 25 n=1 Tax=Amphilophus citrinellus TaxID=61819 RepID=A0A3Q0RDV2_AMPCI